LISEVSLKRICPTLYELLAFDAIARNTSLTQAANELCITVSAVSKQLSSIESFLDQKLTVRAGRGIELTAVGRAYWQKISPCLRGLETASFEARSGSHNTGMITLASVPTFLTKWLIPKLPKFSARYPGSTLSFSQHLNANEAIPPGVDAAIRYGSGYWPGVNADYIAGKEFMLAFSPTLLKEKQRRLSYITKQTLLHHEQAPQAWSQWAQKAQLPVSATIAGPRFAQYSSLIQAAVSGLGVGLVPRALIQDELKNGTLASLESATEVSQIIVEQGHYLCYAHEKINLPVFAAFRQWILLEGEQDNIRAGNRDTPIT
jgi:LysR family transcriptional regulator, glycine cleavage system transcriptional activator